MCCPFDSTLDSVSPATTLNLHTQRPTDKNNTEIPSSEAPPQMLSEFMEQNPSKLRRLNGIVKITRVYFIM